jgi:hypothetical protein
MPFYSTKSIKKIGPLLKSGKVNYWTGIECKRFEKEFSKYLDKAGIPGLKHQAENTSNYVMFGDEYPEIIKLFLTKRIARSGSGDYLNFANLFANAKGEHFCVLDGDDFWSDENKLQKQINFLDQNQD